ncbi:MAG: T9SS type A sorting domain-containing protein [Bacteroidetes bacterium]|nr:T9SS type A sorting domain-containing protein [Bacteroidota bacterium]
MPVTYRFSATYRILSLILLIGLFLAPPAAPPVHGQGVFIMKTFDSDGDGELSDGDEPGAGIDFEVIDPATGEVVASGTTDEAGHLQLDLEPGDYVVREVNLPEGVEPISPAGGETEVTVSPSAGAELLFLNTPPPPPTVPVPIRKWYDLDENDQVSSGDAPAEGIAFQALRDGEVVAEGATDASGRLQFDLEPGDYVVREVGLPEGVEPILPAGGETSVSVSPPAVSEIPFLNPPPTICIFKWLDLNGDGILDRDVDGVGAGITFQVLQDGTVVAEGTTDETGLLKLRLPPGDYVVREVNLPEGVEPISPADGAVDIVLEPGLQIEIDFLNTPPPGTSEEKDWGDLPDPYPTLSADNGPSHILTGSGPFLGAGVDKDPDGQPRPFADGDDKDQDGDDEDGIVFLNLPSGGTGEIEVTVGRAGQLDAWIDFNDDGDFADPQEQIARAVPLGVGVHLYTFPVPQDVGPRFARFRFSGNGNLPPTGEAPNGEVEDYQIRSRDYGDAPNAGVDGILNVAAYPTLGIEDGARHIITPKLNYLGDDVDADPDGQPDPYAFGDDGDADDDEDGLPWDGTGVIRTSPPAASSLPFVPGLVAGRKNVEINVIAHSNSALDAWIDWNRDGDWDDTGEKVFDAENLAPGDNTLLLDVPANARTGYTYARFRSSGRGGLEYYGLAPDGEVEDYILALLPQVDLGDAPDTYATRVASYGPRHVLTLYRLGEELDGEFDGQPDSLALGDDQTGVSSDDEDGLSFATGLHQGQTASVNVTVTDQRTPPPSQLYLQGWIDWNRDGDFADADEQVFQDEPVMDGSVTLDFPVPAAAASGRTYARFRLSEEQGLSFADSTLFPIPGGEVEDYVVEVGDASTDAGHPSADVPDAFALHQNYPNPFNPRTTITFEVSEQAHVVLSVWDALGQKVKTLVDAPRAPGRHTVEFQADALPSGVYFYRVEAGSFQATKRMVLMK